MPHRLYYGPWTPTVSIFTAPLAGPAGFTASATASLPAGLVLHAAAAGLVTSVSVSPVAVRTLSSEPLSAAEISERVALYNLTRDSGGVPPTVLGVDFDGVLNDGEQDAVHGVLRPAFGAILDAALHGGSEPWAVGSVGIVVLSSWRFHFPINVLEASLLGIGVRAPVVGVVGGRQKLNGWDFRADHFRWWLGEHPQITRWAVIDDVPSHYGLIRLPDGKLGRNTYGRPLQPDLPPLWVEGRLVVPRGGLAVGDVTRIRQALEGRHAL